MPPIYIIAEAVRRESAKLGVKLVWGGVWDRAFDDLPDDREGIEAAVHDYVKRRLAVGKKAFIDGPHYQLA